MKKSMHILGFAAKINGIIYPAAVFKFTGADVYWWDCHHPSNGHTIVFDIGSLPVNKSVPLSQGKVFQAVVDQHRSYHESGDRHLAITASSQRKDHVMQYKSVAIEKITAWESLSSLEVPLIGPFFEGKIAGPSMKRTEILRTEDFNGAGGVCLHAYICRSDRVADLIQVWRRKSKRHWIAGDGALRLVVLAERL